MNIVNQDTARRVPTRSHNIFYDHVIRNEKDYNNFANYIYLNPFNWINDNEYR